MDFFEHQDAARRNTTRLVVLFVLAVMAIVVVTYLVIAGAFVLSEGAVNAHPAVQMDVYRSEAWDGVGSLDGARGLDAVDRPAHGWRRFWDPMLLLYVGSGTLLVVGLSSLYKVSQLSGGGHVVAEALNGRLLHPDTQDQDERKLLNVVEEMAIASGTPVPPVYLMDEDGINAFAAGYSTNDAVIGVTRGAIRTLSRDELQGVIAHEFSHILNGDMKLNIRLMGIVFGILAIGLIGQMLFRAALYSGHGRSSRRSGGKDNNPLPLIAIGVALVVVGYIGVFFGNLIKAAVSRQREFLADAAAVQFTRNPDGIAGALKAIGGFASGSKINAPGANEVSHMFFGQAFTSWLGGALATHPPLAERIKRIDPSFDGAFSGVKSKPRPSKSGAADEVSRGFAGVNTDRHPPQARTADQTGRSDLSDSIRFIGAPSLAHVEQAREIIASVPQALRQAARDSFSARALVFALLIDTREAVRTNQFDILTQLTDPPTVLETRRMLGAIRALSAAGRLPLIEMALPALAAMSVSQHRVFREAIAQLARADDRLTIFEWMLEQVLSRHVTTRFENVSRTPAHYYTLKPVLDEAGLLLSALAWAGHEDAADARQAYNAGMVKLTEIAKAPPPRMSPREQVRFDALDAALASLNRLAPRLKKHLLIGCAVCISSDRQVTVVEAELFRAVADVLGCPVPPIVASVA